MNQLIRPRPSKLNLLQRLKESGVPISEVVDVGVNEKTGELIHAFPNKRHHLFEPVNTFFPEIKKNYMGIDYVLYPMALSDENREMYLIQSSLKKNGIVTHSHIGSESASVDGLIITACETILVRRFYDLNVMIEKNFLLKVDVDGKDINVLKGFDSKLSQASVIIVEAASHKFYEVFDYVHKNGFHFFDIIDMVYYGPGLYQCDIVFIRNDLINSTLRPPIEDFIPDLWCKAHTEGAS